MMGKIPNIHLINPVPYGDMVYLMMKSYFILTDSGGIQEEAPSLGKPVLVMRTTTERREAIEAGCSRLVGTSKNKIVKAAVQLLEDSSLYKQMSKVKNPFGKGDSAVRIVKILERRLIK
jgi:UDP-N-acetylglucosamine 2-epimerase